MLTVCTASLSEDQDYVCSILYLYKSSEGQNILSYRPIKSNGDIPFEGGGGSALFPLALSAHLEHTYYHLSAKYDGSLLKIASRKVRKLNMIIKNILCHNVIDNTIGHGEL